MNLKLRQITGTFVLGIGLLTACVAAPAPTATPAGQPAQRVTAEPIPLKVGALPFLSNAILQIAQEEGYFAEQGLKVELVPLQSPNDALPLLVKGELDIATTALTAGLFNVVANGGNVKLVLPLTSFAAQDCASIGILARRSDIDAGRFAAPAQWKAAKVTLPSASVQSTDGYVLDQALHRGGLTLQNVTITPADLPVQADALASGQTDLVYAVEPWVTRMAGNPALALLMPLEPFAPGLTASLIAFGAKPLATPAIGERFAVAYLKAVRQYTQGKTPRNVELVAAYTKLDKALVEKICWPVLPQDGNLNTDSIMAYQAWLKGQNVLDRTLAASEFSDKHFAEAANQILGKAKP
ncbi:MAG: ABC transporter substrate-binding protein [Chloroflexi bacterium]|nr:ABC transporter substrate-binding protein [Chloroflexota bacterium]